MTGSARFLDRRPAPLRRRGDAARAHEAPPDAACSPRPTIPSDTSRAIRSPQRPTGAGPAAMAVSTLCGDLRDRHDDRAHARQRRDAARRDAAADDDARRAGGPGSPSHAERGLAVRRLLVDAALAGDHEIGRRERVVEPRLLHDQVHARMELERRKPVREAQQPEPHAARRAGARRLALTAAGCHLERVREPGEPRVEDPDLLRVGALLRPVRRGGAERSEQRVGDVARDPQARLREPRIQAGKVDGRRSSSTRAPSARRIPAPPSLVALPPIPSAMSRIPASSTARSTSPVPRLVARAASRAVRGDQRQAGGRGHLDERAPPSSRTSQRARIGRPSGSIASASRHAHPPDASIAASVPSPPSASGASRTSSSGRARRQPPATALRDLDARERALERVGGDEDVERPAR